MDMKGMVQNIAYLIYYTGSNNSPVSNNTLLSNYGSLYFKETLCLHILSRDFYRCSIGYDRIMTLASCLRYPYLNSLLDVN